MELVAGRAFAPNLSTDTTAAVLVNEALVRAFGGTNLFGGPLKGLTDPTNTPPLLQETFHKGCASHSDTVT